MIEKEYKSELIGFKTTPHLANRLKIYCKEKEITISEFFSEILENLEDNPEILENEIKALQHALDRKKTKLQGIRDKLQEEREARVKALADAKIEAEQKEKDEKEFKAEQQRKKKGSVKLPSHWSCALSLTVRASPVLSGGCAGYVPSSSARSMSA